MAEDRVLTAAGFQARSEERRAENKPITADILKAVKEGFDKLQQTVIVSHRNITYSDFADIIGQVAEVSAKVGGVEIAARAAEILAELTESD